MKIAVIGTGSVGAALGKSWGAKTEHEVVYGSRRPGSDEVRELVSASGEKASAAAPEEAARGADVVVLALPWEVAEENLRQLDLPDGTVVVDCTNPFEDDMSGLALGTDTSAAERLAEAAPGVHVVKAFSTTGAHNMADPLLEGRRAPDFVAGDDDAARQRVIGLGRDLGFEPIDCGPLRIARYLEPLAGLWVHLAMTGASGAGRDFAFDLIRRSSD